MGPVFRSIKAALVDRFDDKPRAAQISKMTHDP
jgi:hypothetical protein